MAIEGAVNEKKVFGGRAASSTWRMVVDLGARERRRKKTMNNDNQGREKVNNEQKAGLGADFEVG